MFEYFAILNLKKSNIKVEVSMWETKGFNYYSYYYSQVIETSEKNEKSSGIVSYKICQIIYLQFKLIVELYIELYFAKKTATCEI